MRSPSSSQPSRHSDLPGAGGGASGWPRRAGPGGLLGSLRLLLSPSDPVLPRLPAGQLACVPPSSTGDPCRGPWSSLINLFVVEPYAWSSVPDSPLPSLAPPVCGPPAPQQRDGGIGVSDPCRLPAAGRAVKKPLWLMTNVGAL